VNFVDESAELTDERNLDYFPIVIFYTCHFDALARFDSLY